jgi:hypothetical protein
MIHIRLNGLTFQKIVFVLPAYSWLLRVTVTNKKLKGTGFVISVSVSLIMLSNSLVTVVLPQATK